MEEENKKIVKKEKNIFLKIKKYCGRIIAGIITGITLIMGLINLYEKEDFFYTLKNILNILFDFIKSVLFFEIPVWLILLVLSFIIVLLIIFKKKNKEKVSFALSNIYSYIANSNKKYYVICKLMWEKYGVNWQVTLDTFKLNDLYYNKLSNNQIKQLYTIDECTSYLKGYFVGNYEFDESVENWIDENIRIDIKHPFCKECNCELNTDLIKAKWICPSCETKVNIPKNIWRYLDNQIVKIFKAEYKTKRKSNNNLLTYPPTKTNNNYESKTN